ncbi:F0F1 ATP synthase subunit A [Porcipelethomonas sp.]|uniref:F0F1 ATP synthase subunit A n=1 Tax=Porcipelethomonas sp. TaxID=2981675 RepID=UPI003EF15A3D
MKASDFIQGAKEVNVHGPKIAFHFDVFGVRINVTETILISWAIVIALTALVLFLTHDMKKKPEKKRQVIAEFLVETVDNLVKNTMGEGYKAFGPYIAALFASSIFGSLVSLIGLRSVTADFSTTLTWALMSFIMIEAAKIKADGVGGYLKSFINPLNIVSEVSTPVSMSFRHFGNVAGGMIITSLIYFALTGLSNAIGLVVPVFTIGLPAILSLYFDLFSGFMQAFIFIMLTMIYISSAKAED